MTIKTKKDLNNNFTLGNLITISIVVIFIGVIIGMSLNTHKEQPINNIQPAQTVFTSNTLKIAKEFACSCGTCGEKNLAVCVCGTAIDTKNFIEGNLNNGIPELEVVELVKEYYGHYVGASQLQSFN